MMTKKLQVAVLVENHPYDVINFQKMLDSFVDCECYVQPIDLFVQDEDNKSKYDTVLYYNMNWDPPASDSPIGKYLEMELGESSQGIIILHHALLSFQKMDLYTQVTGVRHRGADGLFKYTQNQRVQSKIVDSSHPITQEVKDFELIDETYIIGEPEELGNHILVTTDNKTSIKNIAWARKYKKSKVFCYASGHNNLAYANESFRKILYSGILWTACNR